MALVTATLETAISPPLELELLKEPGTGAAVGAGAGGGGPWWGRLLKPRLTVNAPFGRHTLEPYGAPGNWTTGALVVAAALAALVVLAGVGLVHLVKRP